MNHRATFNRKLAYYLKHRYCPQYRRRAREMLRHARYGRDAWYKAQKQELEERTKMLAAAYALYGAPILFKRF